MIICSLFLWVFYTNPAEMRGGASVLAITQTLCHQSNPTSLRGLPSSGCHGSQVRTYLEFSWIASQFATRKIVNWDLYHLQKQVQNYDWGFIPQLKLVCWMIGAPENWTLSWRSSTSTPKVRGSFAPQKNLKKFQDWVHVCAVYCADYLYSVDWVIENSPSRSREIALLVFLEKFLRRVKCGAWHCVRCVIHSPIATV